MKPLQECHDCGILTQVKRTSCDGCVRPAAQTWTANAVIAASLSEQESHSVPQVPKIAGVSRHAG